MNSTSQGQAPDTFLLTGPAFQQVPTGQLVVTPTGGTRQTLADALTAGIGLVTFGNVQTNAPFWGASGTQGGFTFGALWTAECDFDWVRLLHVNFDTTNPTNITSAAIAVTSTVGDTANPTDSTGTPNNTLWTPVTYNNLGAGGLGPSPSGSLRTITLPPATQNTLGATSASDHAATAALSDWIPAASLPRLDVAGGLPLLLTRSYSSTYQNTVQSAQYTLGQTPVGGAAWDPYANGRIIRATGLASDTATTPGTVTVTPRAYLAPYGVQFMARKRGLSIMNIGDSLSQGAGTISLENSPFHIAATALSTPSFPVSVQNGAYSGMSSLSFQQNAYTFLNLYSPSVVFMKGESPNDTYTTATIEASISRLFQFAAYCVDKGIVPVLQTACPFAQSGAAEAARQAYNTVIRNAGWLYVDFDGALADPANPSHNLPAYNSATNPPHYNDAGSAAVAVLVTAVLQKILANKPRGMF